MDITSAAYTSEKACRKFRNNAVMENFSSAHKFLPDIHHQFNVGQKLKKELPYGMASDTLKLFMLDVGGGKIGQTTLRRFYFEPLLCKIFYERKPVSEHLPFRYESLPWPFGRNGRQVSSACLQWLERKRIWYKLAVTDPSQLTDYLKFTFFRDPCDRVISGFIWSLRQRGLSESAYLNAPSFAKTVQDPSLLSRSRYGRAGHIRGLNLQTYELSKFGVTNLDFWGCTHTLTTDLNMVINRSNARPEIMKLPPIDNKQHVNPTPSPFRKNHLLRSYSGVLCSTTCSGRLHSDCALVPCRKPGSACWLAHNRVNPF